MKKLLAEIRELLLSARSSISRGVDLMQVLTNFEIGRRIVKHEQRGSERAEYGKRIIKELSAKLFDEFGNGFSKRNLEYMRRFYLEYQDRRPQIAQTPSAQSVIPDAVGAEKVQTVSAQFALSWSHYIFLMSIPTPDERHFYEIEAIGQSWPVRELKRQFSAGLYERLALSRDKDGVRRLAKEGQVISSPRDLLKEPYVLEFLGLKEEAKYSESDLESAIIDKLEHFLLELGKGFLFEARQKRFTFDADHFFVDLVFYNRLLRCYVLIDLKIGKLTHQDLGQMQMYVNYFDRHVKLKAENPTVGIILCKKKQDALVEITLPPDANIHAKEYRLYLPDKEELKKKLLEWAVDAEDSKK